MFGFDINPLAVLISKVKFTKISPDIVEQEIYNLRNNVFEFLKMEIIFLKYKYLYKNIDYLGIHKEVV